MDSFNAIRERAHPDRIQLCLLVGIDLQRYLVSEPLNLITKVEKSARQGGNNITWIYHLFPGTEMQFRYQVWILSEINEATTVETNRMTSCEK